jgi:hypothetical protein
MQEEALVVDLLRIRDVLHQSTPSTSTDEFLLVPMTEEIRQ